MESIGNEDNPDYGIIPDNGLKLSKLTEKDDYVYFSNQTINHKNRGNIGELEWDSNKTI